MKRALYLLAALALLATGYAFGVSSTLPGQASPLAQANTCQTFPETKQTVCGRFLAYWQQHGGLAQQGFPISGEFQERSDLNGQLYTVQYFERAVFEYHPENQPPNDVLLSQLGTFRYREKYGSGQPNPGQPTAQPPAAATATQPATSEVSLLEPVTRNGLTFTLIRVDRLAKRTDVAYTVENNTAGPVTFVFKNSDQQLLDESNQPLGLANPSGVTTVTIQKGDKYTGGTTFNGALAGRSGSGTYIANNITLIGNVIVHIPSE